MLIFRLWVIIFTQERAPRQTFTYSKSTIETLNSKDIRTNFYCIYCYLWTNFIPFSNVSAVEFEQVNVCWFLPYRFMNGEITYCYNYWQMYKNPSEIAAHKKRLRSKVAVLKKNSLKVTAFIGRTQIFFSSYSVFLFHKSSCGHPLLDG